MTKSSLGISIVIPVYNGGENFAKCLASIKGSLRQPLEVIVVSDADTDGSWQVAEAFGAKVLRLPTQGGPARARNVGAKVASGDILFFMDADVTLHPDTLSLIEQQFEQLPGLAALIGSYDDAPGADNFLSQYKNLFHHYTHQVSSEVAYYIAQMLIIFYEPLPITNYPSSQI
jgi:glycosyltransferase involved in cell wall biosynthesis